MIGSRDREEMFDVQLIRRKNTNVAHLLDLDGPEASLGRLPPRTPYHGVTAPQNERWV